MKNIKAKTYTTAEKLICDGTDKKNYLVNYRMLIFFIDLVW